MQLYWRMLLEEEQSKQVLRQRLSGYLVVAVVLLLAVAIILESCDLQDTHLPAKSLLPVDVTAAVLTLDTAAGLLLASQQGQLSTSPFLLLLSDESDEPEERWLESLK